jgi:hypothetical protein
MVGRVKGGGRAPPTLTRLGWIYHHDGLYARKWLLPVFLYSLVCGRGQCQLQNVETLKGVWHKIFNLWFLSCISFPRGPKYSMGAVSNFFWKFEEIFANEFLSFSVITTVLLIPAKNLSPVSLTPVNNYQLERQSWKQKPGVQDTNWDNQGCKPHRPGGQDPERECMLRDATAEYRRWACSGFLWFWGQ